MHTLIIAEAGVNHNGSMDLARQLIESAAQAGADFVKFQTFKADSLVSKSAKKAEYQQKNINDGDDSQYEMLKKLEISETMHHELIAHCNRFGIKLNRLNIPFFKIPSGEITNKPYLKYIAEKCKPVIMSTGMANLREINAALEVLVENGVDKNEITVLHCNTEYPTPMHDVNLKAMWQIRDVLGVKVGYSDHTSGIEVAIAAVALGATVIEKHFTLDRNLPGPDHKASLEPNELKALVKAIRNIELAISGSGIKEPSESEKPNIIVARKSIHLSKSVSSGTKLTAEHLIMKRPGNGITPMEIDKVIGKTLNQTLEADTQLLWEHLEN